MELYKKNRLLFWLLLFLIVMNLSALISFCFFMQKKPASTCDPAQAEKCNVFQQELDLSDDQVIRVEEINMRYRSISEPLVGAIREKRDGIMNELENTNPDTNILIRHSMELSTLQNKMQKENIRQYLALKKICNPEQLQRLSGLYRELYGCPMKEKGKQHRYRHGQNKGKE